MITKNKRTKVTAKSPRSISQINMSSTTESESETTQLVSTVNMDTSTLIAVSTAPSTLNAVTTSERSDVSTVGITDNQATTAGSEVATDETDSNTTILATTDYSTSIDQTADATTDGVNYTTEAFDETIEPRTESTTEETTRLALTTVRQTTDQSPWVPTTHEPDLTSIESSSPEAQTTEQDPYTTSVPHLSTDLGSSTQYQPSTDLGFSTQYQPSTDYVSSTQYQPSTEDDGGSGGGGGGGSSDNTVAIAVGVSVAVVLVLVIVAVVVIILRKRQSNRKNRKNRDSEMMAAENWKPDNQTLQRQKWKYQQHSKFQHQPMSFEEIDAQPPEGNQHRIESGDYEPTTLPPSYANTPPTQQDSETYTALRRQPTDTKELLASSRHSIGPMALDGDDPETGLYTAVNTFMGDPTMDNGYASVNNERPGQGAVNIDYSGPGLHAVDDIAQLGNPGYQNMSDISQADKPGGYQNIGDVSHMDKPGYQNIGDVNKTEHDGYSNFASVDNPAYQDNTDLYDNP